MKRIFQLFNAKGVQATITIESQMIAGAEQNLVILGDDLTPVAVIEMQPGVDRREV